MDKIVDYNVEKISSKINIKYLPKDILLYELWLNAYYAPHIKAIGQYIDNNIINDNLELEKSANSADYAGDIFSGNIHINLTLRQTADDIYHLRNNHYSNINSNINSNNSSYLTIYYGKYMYIDIIPDICNVYKYNKYNGVKNAEKIINRLQLYELSKALCNFYKYR